MPPNATFFNDIGDISPLTARAESWIICRMHIATQPAAPAQRPQDEIPEVPPKSLRGPYLKLSQAYVRWCLGMLVWCVLCVGYFILTWQRMEMLIGMCLGVLLLAMILFPATLFGGETWYKRLGWVTVLSGLFSIMSIYPLVAVGWGVWKRFGEGRYRGMPMFTDIWHAVLSVMTIGVTVWTVIIARRSWKLVKKLKAGDFSE
jgi:hypothetical protein